MQLGLPTYLDELAEASPFCELTTWHLHDLGLDLWVHDQLHLHHLTSCQTLHETTSTASALNASSLRHAAIHSCGSKLDQAIRVLLIDGDECLKAVTNHSVCSNKAAAYWEIPLISNQVRTSTPHTLEEFLCCSRTIQRPIIKRKLRHRSTACEKSRDIHLVSLWKA